MHPLVRKEHPVDGIHVGDDRVDATGFVRGQPGIQRLEREESVQPLVGKALGDQRAQVAEGTHLDQARRRLGAVDQSER